MSGQFTDHPERPSTIVFPHQTAQAVCFTIFLLAFAMVSGMITRRTMQLNVFSWKSWRKLSSTKVLSIWVFIDSWVFLLFAGILLFGVGTSTNETSCTAAVISCLTFYFISKVLISLFLLERVHIVNSQDGTPRMKSTAYKICLVALSFFVGYPILATIARVEGLDSERSCHIGIKLWVSIPQIFYDVFLALLLAACFLYPIRRQTTYNLPLRKMAFRTIIATLVSFITSAINIALLSAWRGHQHAWFCLLACSLDILINAIAIYWVTKPGECTNNAEGFDTSLLLITSRKSVDQHHEKNGSVQHKVTTFVEPRLPANDKDAYLKPQPNVYYPMGCGLATYEDETWSNTLTGVPPEVDAQPPTIPEPILIPTSRVEHAGPFPRCSTSDESGSSARSHKVDARSVNELERSSSDDREIGFFDFLGEPPGDSCNVGADRPGDGQEEEGKCQKAFFQMLLGRGKTSTSGVGLPLKV